MSLIERIKKKELADKCTIPFVPYRGSAYGDVKPKILVIGKATYGWGEGEEGQGSGSLKAVLRRNDLWDHLSKLPKKFIEGQIIPFYGGEKNLYHSPFWNRIYRLAGNFLCDRAVLGYKRERQRSEKCFQSIAWSNVFKVGALKTEGGNPNKDLISIQKKAEEENKKENKNTLLEEEIDVLKPNVVIFSTGPDYDEHIKNFLPRITAMRDVVDPEHLKVLKIKEIEGLGCPAFRTYHFQYYSNEAFKQVVHHIRGAMNGTVF